MLQIASSKGRRCFVLKIMCVNKWVNVCAMFLSLLPGLGNLLATIFP